ncbi:hypothetical protein ALC53_06757 [Atta colombica]|uniref:Uncharacterized protein n=1 Tax=Atta colombica TaxID=520822 RepID=A0A151I2X2_9HYME|nr:hypothetical protein ALC53_06757 [Atta colombica]
MRELVAGGRQELCKTTREEERNSPRAPPHRDIRAISRINASSTWRYPLNFFPLHHRIVNIITVRRGGNLDRLTAVTLEMVELKETDWPSRRFTEESLNRDNAFIIAALSFILYAKTIIEAFTVDQKPSRRHISRSLIDQVIGISILMRGQFHELLDSFYYSSGCRFPSPLPPSWGGGGCLPASSLHNLLFPSNLPNPVVPSSDWSSMPDCGSSEMTNCPAKQNEMQNFENTWIKVSVCPDYIP